MTPRRWRLLGLLLLTALAAVAPGQAPPGHTPLAPKFRRAAEKPAARAKAVAQTPRARTAKTAPRKTPAPSPGVVRRRSAQSMSMPQKASPRRLEGTFPGALANMRHAFNAKRPPSDPSGRARDIRTRHGILMLRLVGPGDRPDGAWLVRPSAVVGKTASAIKSMLAIPGKVTHVSLVAVPPGTRLRVSRANAQPGWGRGGGTQYELRDRLPARCFSTTVPLGDGPFRMDLLPVRL